MTKHTWLKKYWNIECVPSSWLGKLIRGFYTWSGLVRTRPNDVNVRIFWKCATNSQNNWFYCFIFLRPINTSSMEITISFSIDIITKPMNCNIGKRRVIHNFNCYFKKWVIYNFLKNYNIFVKKRRNPFSTPNKPNF